MNDISIPAIIRKIFPLTISLDLERLGCGHVRHVDIALDLTNEGDIVESGPS